MRRRHVWRDGQWVELDLSRPPPKPLAPAIWRDLPAYRSVVTREPIEGRAAHREHLRAHDCVEIGNEFVAPPQVAMSPVEASVQRALEASPERHAEARAVAQRAAEVELPA